jgi:hypothetical protein
MTPHQGAPSFPGLIDEFTRRVGGLTNDLLLRLKALRLPVFSLSQRGLTRIKKLNFGSFFWIDPPRSIRFCRPSGLRASLNLIYKMEIPD